MKKGANMWCFPTGWSLEQSFQYAHKVGFDGVEINLEEFGQFSLETSEKEMRHIYSAARNEGIELPSLSTALFWKYSLTDGSKDIQVKAKYVARKMIESAAIMNIPVILIVPGVVNEGTDYQVAYHRSQECLSELGDFAASHQVQIGVENVWNKFLLSPLEMKRFINEINHPAVKSYFDVGNVLVSGYPEQWIRILDQLILRIHVKDFKMEIGNITGFTTLLQGDIRWKEVRQALLDIGYDGYLTSEIPAHKTFPEQSLFEISKAMDRIIQG